MKDTKKITIEESQTGFFSIRLNPAGNTFLDRWADKMNRSKTGQLDKLLEWLAAGNIDAVEYELRNIGVEIKAKGKVEK